MIKDMDFATLRPEGGDRREGFEEFSCQIFRRLTVPAGSRHERYRGAGGDGGVEAVWRLLTGDVIGLQSKFFLPLKDAHRAQVEKSLDTALDNHPTLRTYIVSLPFDPTPTVKARKGQGEAEKLETWRAALVARAAARGATVDVQWWPKSELKSRLLGLDNAAGRIRYWFGTTAIDASALQAAVTVSEGVARKRYSPELSVDMAAQTILRAFAWDETWLSQISEQWGDRIDDLVSSWASRSPEGHAAESLIVSAALGELKALVGKVLDVSFQEVDRQVMETAAVRGRDHAGRLVEVLKTEFDAKHGAGSDTQGWRQYQMEYMVAFPAADLDLARGTSAFFEDVARFARDAALTAAGQPALLMRGPAGIGKTHTIIDFAKGRVAAGHGAIAILGEEVTLAETPWRVLASKIGLPADTPKMEIVGVMSARAESDGRPFLLMIDAINETPDRSRWRAWLPDLIEALKHQPVRLLLSCRDIYVSDALEAGATTLFAFTHDGFAGREYEAAYAFAAFYGVGPPAEIIAQPEFANPLFLHLACRAAQVRGWSALTGGQSNLTALVAAILDGANIEAARHLDFDPRIRNPVKEGAFVLAATMAASRGRSLPIAIAERELQKVFASSGASGSLLRALEAADLITVMEEGGAWTLRFAFERLGDMLIAQASLEGQDRAKVVGRFSSGDLAALVADEATMLEHAGLLQAYSILLPEAHGVELADQVVDPDRRRIAVRLALGVLAWRDPRSASSSSWFEPFLNRADDVAEILDQLMVVAAMPSHPLNIDWLGAFLWRRPLVDRDALWTWVVTQSWEGKRSVHRLIRTALDQDLGHLSVQSARKLATTLAWFCACSDRGVRELSIGALARLMAQQDVAAVTLDAFGSIDDDYVLEGVLAAVYGAGLRRKEPAYWEIAAAVAYRHVFDSGAVPENAQIRDLARLIVEEADRAGMLPVSVVLAKARPPYVSQWPLTFVHPDWTAISTAYPDIPRNMMFENGALSPDFARYKIKPRVEEFDLASAGLDVPRLSQWVFEHTLALGYPGSGDMAMNYDNWLVGRYGSGRSRASAPERLGKKYSRIALARLVGRLHDHVSFPNTRWQPAPSPSALQAVKLRDVDPSRFSVATTKSSDADVLNRFPRLVPNDLDIPAEVWTQIDGLDLRVVDDGDDPWVVFAGDWTFHVDDEASGDSRSSGCIVRSDIVPSGRVAAARKKLRTSAPSVDLPELRDLYLGEYPQSRAFEDTDFGWLPVHGYGTATVVTVQRIERAWLDRDTIWCPAPDMIRVLGLTWDGDRGWLDPEGRLVAVHVKQDRAEAVLMRRTTLEAHLSAIGAILIWSISESRNALQAHDIVANVDRTSAWEWRRGRVAKVAEHFQRWSKSRELGED